jgi:hypothetical protein
LSESHCRTVSHTSHRLANVSHVFLKIFCLNGGWKPLNFPA